jgi:ribonuclease HI
MPDSVSIHTDGACIRNPGPGGYAAVLVFGGHRREISGGFRLTTNNRMEIMAAIAGLSALKTPCTVTLYSDSQYLIRSMKQGWVRKWKANSWRRNKREKAANVDLWEKLLVLDTKHKVSYVWIRGHAGNIENERCDRLATTAAGAEQLQADEEFEESAIPYIALSAAPGASQGERTIPDKESRQILAVLHRCREDADAVRVEYDDSDGFIVYAATKQGAWRYAFKNLAHAYTIASKAPSIRPYRTEFQ